VRTHLSSASFRNLQVTQAGASTAAAYADSWASGASTGWAGYGGSWSTIAGGIERQSASATDGPKFASPIAGDAYTVSSDVRLTSLTAPSGNAGVLARMTSPGVGPDAYTGYFAGVDGSTGRLSLGKANGSWTPLADTGVPGGVQVNSWYRVTLRTSGCTITATGQRTSSWDQARVSVTDPSCATGGTAGVRAMLAAADFREFLVSKG
jgi:hypothetical protein